MNNQTNTGQIIKKLEAVLFKRRLVLFIAGLVITSAAVLTALLLLSLVAQFIILPVIVKNSLLILAAGATIFFFTRYALRRMFEGTIDTVALELESKHTELKGLLIAAIQFARMKKDPGYSGELIDATHKKALSITRSLNFSEAVSYSPIFKNSRYLAISAVMAILMLLIIPGLFSYSYEVYSNPSDIIAPPIAYELAVDPPSSEWVKYRDLTIGGALYGLRLPEKAIIHYRFAGGNWQKETVDTWSLSRHAMSAGDSLSFGYTLRQVTKSLDFYVEAGRLKSEIQSIDVVDKPRVTGLKLSIFSPEYTGIEPAVIDENNGSFSAVVGSRVNLSIITNLKVTNAELVLEDSSVIPMTVENRSAQANLVLTESKGYHIRLRNHLGEVNPDPIGYYMTAIPDEYPVVEVLFPGYDVNLNDDMLLPLKVRLFDDFGLSSLVLKYQTVSAGRTSEEHVAVIHYSERIKTQGIVDFNWDMAQLGIMPGEYAIYYFELADNDVVSGPKVTQSRKFIARVPSLDEIISQMEDESTRRISSTEQMLKEGKELAKRLKNASRKMQAEMNNSTKNKEWQKQQELESIAEKNSEMVDKIEQAAQEMDKNINQLTEKALFSQEILEKLEQIQKLYEDVATPEMKDARERLMEAMKNMDPDEMQKAMNDFQMSQEELLKRLERTLALLKKMQVEQKMEAMLRQAEELVEQQSAMNDKTADTPEQDLAELAPDETALKEQLEALKQQLDELGELAQDAQMDQSQELQKFQEALKQTDANKDMEEMAGSLENKQKNKAGDEGEQALTKLSQMLNQMQQQMMAMKGEEQDKLKKAMRDMIDDANYLSRNQEQLLEEAVAMRNQMSMMQDLAKEQNDLLRSCNGLKNQIAELGKQSPFLAAELDQMMNQTTTNMESARKQFEDRRSAPATQNQKSAMVDLNQASVKLMESMDQQSQCENGGNCDKNTSNMQALSEKQQQLNKQTQQCQNPGGQKPRPGESGQEMFQRMAAEQGAIRKSVEQMAREFGQSRQILGRLDDIADEMKKVEESLANGDVGTEVTDRQVRIFSRMLEAARSLYRKDFTEQRQAETAESQPFYLPPQLSDDILRGKVNLENRLNDYLKGQYPPQYEAQIKAYFKALMQNGRNNEKRTD